MGNAYAGYWLGGGTGFSFTLLLAMIASACFLLAGMALNDIADAKVDARERPSRPIPSGAISLTSAWFVSLTLIALGFILEALAGPYVLWASLALVLSIFAYNFAPKGRFWGPACMGLCRALNLATGMALTLPLTLPHTDLPFGLSFSGLHFSTETFLNLLTPPQAWGLFSLWAYIWLVTYLARDEVTGNSLRRSRLFFMGLGVWITAWMLVTFSVTLSHPLTGLLGLFAMLGLAYQLFHALRRLWHEPSPAHTGRSIGALLRSLPLVDMLALAAAGIAWPCTLGMILFMLPGAWFMRKVQIT
jgi:4-hydroxybenzoate polyprenyltransferase